MDDFLQLLEAIGKDQIRLLECADIAARPERSCDAALIGPRAAGRGDDDGVDRRTAVQQGHRPRRSAVVAVGGKQGAMSLWSFIGADAVTHELLPMLSPPEVGMPLAHGSARIERLVETPGESPRRT